IAKLDLLLPKPGLGRSERHIDKSGRRQPRLPRDAMVAKLGTGNRVQMAVPDGNVTRRPMADQAVGRNLAQIRLDAAKLLCCFRAFQVRALPRVVRKVTPAFSWRWPESAHRIELRATHD